MGKRLVFAQRRCEQILQDGGRLLSLTNVWGHRSHTLGAPHNLEDPSQVGKGEWSEQNTNQVSAAAMILEMVLMLIQELSVELCWQQKHRQESEIDPQSLEPHLCEDGHFFFHTVSQPDRHLLVVSPEASLHGLQMPIFYVFAWSSVHACFDLNSFSYKDTSHIGFRPNSMTSFYFFFLKRNNECNIF